MLNSDFVYDPIHTDRPSRKLVKKWLGPFRIMKKISRVAYKLFIPKEDNIKVHPVIHIANLKQFNENPERFQQREDFIVPQPIKDSEQESVYLVDDILDMRLFKKKKQFLIKWTGYDDPTWEDEGTLRASPEFNQHINVYEEQLRNGQLVQMKHMRNKRNAKAKIK